MTKRPRRFSRRERSISSAANSSSLKPPTARNAAASQNMNEPAAQPSSRLVAFHSATGGVVVADDELAGPAAPLEYLDSSLQVVQRSGDKQLFVESRNDERKLHCAGGATFTPLTPCFSTSWATSPERFASSTNSTRYFADAARFFATPIDCWTPMNWPSSTRAPGSFCASASSPGLRPASASSF